MAKKGGVQQLQIEINTAEELSKFLDRDGLLIMDVYTEWCGPCIAMVGSLKKIKLEKGGDDLQLAVVKCDHIEVFKRFRNKCEPTWLFVSLLEQSPMAKQLKQESATNEMLFIVIDVVARRVSILTQQDVQRHLRKRKIVNCAFGSNVPKLMTMIVEELDIERKCRDGQADRVYYELTEMCSFELERFNAKKLQDEEIDKIEREAAEAKRRAYITFVTDEIMKHGGDIGVTLYMPHLITRDLFKRMTEQGDKFGLQAKDKKNVCISDENLEVLHFEIDNPLPPYVLKLIKRKEVFMICWKAAELEERPITKILLEMTHLLAEDQPIPDDENTKKPAMLKHQSIILTDEELKELGMSDASGNVINSQIMEEEEFEVVAGSKEKTMDEVEENDLSKKDEVSEEADAPKAADNGAAGSETCPTDNDSTSETVGNVKENKDENEEKKNELTESLQDTEVHSAVDVVEAELTEDKTPKDIEKPEEKPNEFKQNKLARPISGHKFKIPAMWTPANPRAHAAFIYVFFRHLTESFLPPDPIPDPPHVAVAFEAYKRKEIMEVIEHHGDAILAYGYFSSDDIPTATLIANSTFKYNLETPTINDKLFVKVAKKIGNALASLIELSPSHVSQNSEIGYEECLLLFPVGYKNANESGVEPKEPEEEVDLKKKKRKKNKKSKGEEKEEESKEAADEGDGLDDDGDDDYDDDESELDDENVEDCND